MKGEGRIKKPKKTPTVPKIEGYTSFSPLAAAGVGQGKRKKSALLTVAAAATAACWCAEHERWIHQRTRGSAAQINTRHTTHTPL